MSETYTTWAQVQAVLRAARPHLAGAKGKQLGRTSDIKSRGRIFNDRRKETRGKSGGIGADGGPLYRDLDNPRKHPDVMLVRWILMDFEEPERWNNRPVAPVHEEPDP